MVKKYEFIHKGVFIKKINRVVASCNHPIEII